MSDLNLPGHDDEGIMGDVPPGDGAEDEAGTADDGDAMPVTPPPPD